MRAPAAIPFPQIILQVALVSLLLVPTAVSQEERPSEGPKLFLSGVDSGLLQGSQGTVWVELCNRAAEDNRTLEVNASEAMEMMATLESPDERLVVSSGSMPAGSLSPGACRSIPFALEVEKGTEPGLYPLELTIGFQQLAEVSEVGDPRMPQVTFQYDQHVIRLPLEAEVFLGPDFQVDPLRAMAGGQGEMLLHNLGDQAVTEVKVNVSARLLRARGDLGEMEPESTRKMRLDIPEVMEPGDYPLDIRLEYSMGRDRKSRSLATVLTVEEGRGWMGYVGYLGLILLLVLIALAARRVDWGRIWRRKVKRKRW